MKDIPKDVYDAAVLALSLANTEAHMLGEPTDPIECISIAIMTERERCAEHLNEGCTLEEGEPVDPAIPEIWRAITEGL